MNRMSPHIIKKLCLLTAFFAWANFQAQNEPFNCDYNAYLFQYNDVYAIDLASGSSYAVAMDITPGNINAAGYNPKDGYIWGSLSSPARSIVRIGKDFTTTTYTFSELPTSNRYIGDISHDGKYYLKPGGDTYYILDLNPESATHMTSLGTGTLSKSLSIHDWAFNALDNKLYTVEKKTNILYRIDVATGNVETIGEVPILSGLNYTFGAVYFDNMGNFYVSANQTGTIYIVNTVTDLTAGDSISSNIFAFGPSSSLNDGARCPTAPVPMEDCINGQDDDGDGLVDCEDPSCSGVASCPVIEPPTSSANNGGLESNNRLSQQISKRNFMRLKNNYKFDKTKAKKFTKPKDYGKKKSSSSLKLSDFIPVKTIQEDNTIESTPTELVNITNASEILSVDYQKNSKTIASILAIKTDTEVYEHTKYICDRLLGAELLSVSTIDIGGHNFIKSIVRNVDGGVEFVLSLSARPTADNANFDIESHWNLDKYQKNSAYYNFQIWTNSIDNLLLLGQEVVNLLNTQKEIKNYLLSPPPLVFVKKGTYKNGKLELEIINVNRSQSVTLTGGYRTTETTANQTIAATPITLDKTYIKPVTIDTGRLFDIGFRIGDGVNTPDDLFMSDGSWGYDDAAASTTVNAYTISPNTETAKNTELLVERNLYLKATTKEYISGYKAFTARFSPIDVTSYDALVFEGSGTGEMEVRLNKKSISQWEDQFYSTVTLTNEKKKYTLWLKDFSRASNGTPDFNDITTITFTMKSADGTEVTKEMNIKEIKFVPKSSLSTDEISNSGHGMSIIPNPMHNDAVLELYSNTADSASLKIFNQLGQEVFQKDIQITPGKNAIPINRKQLATGLYIVKIENARIEYSSQKLLIH
ncbi:conserved exported hypothetical protein [Tenacibaculum litopenaei]|uniref:DUF6923 family protein n=1 Tax=Tenacibaculum litopenaei TaxID=396016 RepID=UPI003894CB04